ncbi:unnamed protein product [Laminaria digitata]
MERVHQCATVQLDFQLPIRFNLKYSAGMEGQDGAAAAPAAEGAAAAPAKAEGAAPAKGEGGGGGGGGGGGASNKGGGKGKAEMGEMKRPVMIHRAMLGSVERMIAVLTEHYGGKWPFWLSPRQALIVPVAQRYIEYANSVKERLHAAGFFVDAEVSNKTMNKKVLEGVKAKYSFILVVGEAEEAADEVNLRGEGQRKVSELIDHFRALTDQHQ